ncbi:MAG: hypothetical protein IJO73_09220 [Clostridia bacterium]|nr:hypothetical protein [Clostridia bacterium]
MDNFNEYPVEETTEEGGSFSSYDKKGILLVIALALVVVVFIFKLTGSDTGKPVEAQPTATAPTTVVTAAPTTAAPTVAPSATLAPTVTSAVNTEPEKTTSPVQTTAPATTAKRELTKAEILAKVNEGVNSIKADTASFTAVKKQIISIDLIDCSVPALTGAINTVIDFFEGEEILEFDITNGKGPNPEKKGEETVINHEIPPTDKPFTLTVDGVAEATAEETDGGTLYTVKVVPETSTLQNPRPPHHNAACDTLDFSTFSLPLGELTKVDFEYPGATVSVLVDASGKTIRYRERLEMKGVGEGKAIGISGSGSMEGYIDEVWDIQWK